MTSYSASLTLCLTACLIVCPTVCLTESSTYHDVVQVVMRAQIFPPLPIAAPWSGNQQCRQDSRLLLDNIVNHTTWAMQMWDASAKSAVGVYSGSIYQLGNFEECVGTLTPVRGQYCLASVTVDQPGARPIDPMTNIYQPDNSVWNKIMYKSDPSKIRRDTIHWALCVPASCSHDDIQASVMDHLEATRDNDSMTSLKVVVGAELCQTNREEEKFTIGTLIYCGVWILILFFVCVATVYDFVFCGNKDDDNSQKQNHVFAGYLLCFSLKRNFPKFVDYKTSDQSIDCLHGIRVISIILVILGHRIGFPMSGPVQNFEFIESYNKHVSGIVCYQGHLLIEIFFLMSGLLVTYGLLTSLETRSVNPWFAILLRYIRLTPVYTAVVFFHATLMYHLSDGPIWPQVIGPERDACLENWWRNLLYINNYSGTDNMCVIDSWYLPCDFHLFIVAVFVVLLLHKHAKSGQALLAVLAVISVAVPFVITGVKRLDPVLYFYHDVLFHLRSNVFFQALYMKSHARASSYLVGMATGYLLYSTRSHRAQYMWRPMIGYVTSILICAGTLVPGKWFYDYTWQYDVLITVFYAGFHRLFWALGIAIFILSVVYSKRSLFGAFLSCGPMVILSKLVFCLYLVHLPLQQIQYASLKSNQHYGILDQTRQLCADIMLSVIISVVLHLVIEVPTRLISKKLMQTNKKIIPTSSPVDLKDFGTSQTSIVD